MEPKPGWKTTEFWLHIAAVIFAAIQTVDLGDGELSTIVGKVISVVAVVLGALGYSGVRGYVKARASGPDLRQR